MEKFKAGLIGCGNIGAVYDEKSSGKNVYTHAGMLKSIKGVEFVCASETNEKRIINFGKNWNVEKLYKSHNEMLRNENLDLICIATPDNTHTEIILDVLKIQTPKLIFSEKPIADTVSSAARIIRICNEKGVKLIIDYIRRWDKNHQKVREIIQKQKLGGIESVVGYYVRGLRHNGCQMINLLRYLFGEISSVQAIGRNNAGSISGDPSINFIAEFNDGITAVVLSQDQQGYGYSIFELDIAFKEGRIRIIDGGQNIEYFKSKKSNTFSNFKVLSKVNELSDSTYGQAFCNAGKELFDYLKGSKRILTNEASEAYCDLKIIEKIFKSANRNNIKI